MKSHFVNACLRLVLMCLLPAAVHSQSIANGQKIVEKNCMQCHGMDKNADAPALRGVVGRKAGKLADYFYSDALAKATHIWDTSHLKAWLSKPESLVPGVEMDFHLEGAQDIDDVVAYLSTLTAVPSK